MDNFLNGPVVSADPETGVVTKEFTPCCDCCMDTHRMVSEIYQMFEALKSSPMAGMLPGMGVPGMPQAIPFGR